jgi:negative regulator of sigma E activity
MIGFLIATTVTISPMMDEAINRMCANRVGIPYASDNFTDKEWQKFQMCRDIMRDELERNGKNV